MTAVYFGKMALIEEIDNDNSLESEHSVQALSINNNGIAIYKNNE